MKIEVLENLFICQWTIDPYLTFSTKKRLDSVRFWHQAWASALDSGDGRLRKINSLVDPKA